MLEDRSTIVPDGIVKYSINGKTRLFALEIHNGKDSTRIINQLEQHFKSLESGAISLKYGHDKACPVLSVFSNAGIMETVKRRLLENPLFIKVKKGFLFNTLESVMEDLKKGWHFVNGEKIDFFTN